MNTNHLNKIVLTLFICGGVLLVICAFINQLKKDKRLERESRITIGCVYRYSSGFKSSNTVGYSYSINGVEYKSSNQINLSGKKHVNKRFFVKYSPLNPKNSKILLEYPVPDWLIEAPPNGWEEIPKLDMENKRIVE